ncbi:MAG: DUF362 domain-containing protein [Verrucomicrobia bacterium]|nr:DUF362 domain-containing protein [Verrucomicrobiota bacterium]
MCQDYQHVRQRRAFLRRLLAAAAGALWLAAGAPGGAQGLLPPDARGAEASRRSRVVIVHDPRSVEFYSPQTERVARMIERGVVALTQAADADAAWRQFVKPGDVVGIKVNSAPGPAMGTRHEIVSAVVDALRRVGVPARNIIIWDRSDENLVAAGWELRESGEGPLCFGTLPNAGWDSRVYYRVPHVGTIIWGDLEFGERELSERSHYSRIVTERVTKLINIPVLMDNRHVGLSGCLYNIAMGSVDNNRRFQTESLHYDAGIAEICSRPPLSEKLALNIFDALVAQYAGGPKFQPQATWTPGELWLSHDPVALDALALAAIEKRRKEANMPTLRDRGRHVRFAAEMGVGVDERSKMDIVELNP